SAWAPARPQQTATCSTATLLPPRPHAPGQPPEACAASGQSATSENSAPPTGDPQTSGSPWASARDRTMYTGYESGQDLQDPPSHCVSSRVRGRTSWTARASRPAGRPRYIALSALSTVLWLDHP